MAFSGSSLQGKTAIGPRFKASSPHEGAWRMRNRSQSPVRKSAKYHRGGVESITEAVGGGEPHIFERNASSLQRGQFSAIIRVEPKSKTGTVSLNDGSCGR